MADEEVMAGAVDAAVFSPREKPVVAPVLTAAAKDTNTHSQTIQDTDRTTTYWPRLFVQHVLMNKE